MENQLKAFLDKANREKFAIGAFNLDSLETLKALAAAAKKMRAPVLAEVSPGEVDYIGIRNLAALIDNTRREFGIPLFLNLDHAEDTDKIEEALNFGFDLVHYDGSKLSFEKNLHNAIPVVKAAHEKGILVEGEFDHFPGSSELHEETSTDSEQILTDPEMARAFVKETRIDILAVFVGNKHGVYTDGSERINLEHLKKLREILPDTWFSLHGGSGIPAEDIREAIKYGIVKVNINTELRLAWRESLEVTLGDNRHEAAWYKLTEKPIAEVERVIEEKIKVFSGSSSD
ncbi:class II fructose-bisphosphate aldolase [Patescibacteria group bacterium]|nr:class II fructose-bisphosphate aldolase [Patescibacteria group bacterium]